MPEGGEENEVLHLKRLLIFNLEEESGSPNNKHKKYGNNETIKETRGVMVPSTPPLQKQSRGAEGPGHEGR